MNAHPIRPERARVFEGGTITMGDGTEQRFSKGIMYQLTEQEAKPGEEALPSITSFFDHDDPDCPWCKGSGIVCEGHPGKRWEQDDGDGGCDCGAPGMPCPRVPA